MFGDWIVDRKTQVYMYAYFVQAMISDDFEWMGTSLQEQEKDMKIDPRFFEDYIELFRKACKVQEISKHTSELIIEKLHEYKKKICVATVNSKFCKRQMTISE